MFRIFWIFVALDVAAAITLWALFERNVHAFTLIFFALIIAIAVFAAAAFLVFRSASARMTSLILFLLPSTVLLVSAGSSVRDLPPRRFSACLATMTFVRQPRLLALSAIAVGRMPEVASKIHLTTVHPKRLWDLMKDRQRSYWTWQEDSPSSELTDWQV